MTAPSRLGQPDPVRAWARAVGVAYPDDRHGRLVVEMAYQDALVARGVPTCLNPLLRKEVTR